jgi:hypothetical protein
LTDDSGDTTSWPPSGHEDYTEIVVHPAFSVAVEAVQNGDGTVTYAAHPSGGEGDILAVRWAFADGPAAGSTVTRAPSSGTVTVTDGTGATATASF